METCGRPHPGLMDATGTHGADDHDLMICSRREHRSGDELCCLWEGGLILPPPHWQLRLTQGMTESLLSVTGVIVICSCSHLP